MSEAVKWIGRLGGHLGRKSDGPPGLKVVWLGYQRIIDAASIYEMMSLENWVRVSCPAERDTHLLRGGESKKVHHFYS